LPNEEGAPDGTTGPVPAAQLIAPVTSGDDNAGFPAVGYYAMLWPHFVIKDSKLPPFLQVLAKYGYVLPGTRKRLFLLVPYEFVVPTELEDS
jgi:hypothetical protein